MPPKGVPTNANRELIKAAARMRRQSGLSAAKIAKALREEFGTQTHETTVERWLAGGLLSLDVDTPRQVLESLLDDPSARIRLDAAKVLYALEESPTSDQSGTPDHDAVIYADPSDDPPPGLSRPCAVLTVYE